MYSLSRDCSIRRIGNNHLLIVYRGDDSEPLSIRVNESLALLVEYALDVERFSVDDLAGVLVKEYSLPEEQALRDARSTIDIWNELGLI